MSWGLVVLSVCIEFLFIVWHSTNHKAIEVHLALLCRLHTWPWQQKSWYCETLQKEFLFYCCWNRRFLISWCLVFLHHMRPDWFLSLHWYGADAIFVCSTSLFFFSVLIWSTLMSPLWSSFIQCAVFRSASGFYWKYFSLMKEFFSCKNLFSYIFSSDLFPMFCSLLNCFLCILVAFSFSSLFWVSHFNAVDHVRWWCVLACRTDLCQFVCHIFFYYQSVLIFNANKYPLYWSNPTMSQKESNSPEKANSKKSNEGREIEEAIGAETENVATITVETTMCQTDPVLQVSNLLKEYLWLDWL